MNIDGQATNVFLTAHNALNRCALVPLLNRAILTQRFRVSSYSESTVDFMVKPNGLLVTVSFIDYSTSTPVLSTWSSTTALVTFRLGKLISGKVSRLYAFSVYPDQTSLPSSATGVTTGSQEVCSSRSSRTKDNPPQFSCAHHR